MSIKEKYITKPNVFVALLVFVVSIGLLITVRPQQLVSGAGQFSSPYYEAHVTSITSQGNQTNAATGISGPVQYLTTETSINNKTMTVSISNDLTPVSVGDMIFVQSSTPDDPTSFSIAGVSRQNGLLLLAALFILLILFISGRKGAYALVGLLFSFAVIWSFVIPRILAGNDPIMVGIIGAALILIVTGYLSYGFNKKSIAAFAGMLMALILVGIVSSVAVHTMGFTGNTNDETLYLLEADNKINLVGLLVAGIIIAAIGILDDVAVTQSSTVFGLASINKELKRKHIFKEAMEIGKDHIAAVINTLVMAYAGASFPLILFFATQHDMPASYIVSNEEVAQEIVRTLISSSGLILAIPLTTIVATLMIGKKDSAEL